MYPDIIAGLSDHTIGHSTVLGAVALGGKVIEKHFTDDNTRSGPDHPFSMMPDTWREMVDRTRELEFALGDYSKYLQENEGETVVLQRRCIRANHSLKRGDIITRNDIEFQRPAPNGSIPPNDIYLVIGKTLKADVKKGEHISLEKNLM
jgi:N-acetylneuraminate synthase